MFFTAGTGAAAAAIFCARNKALLFVRGVMAGACMVLRRGFALAGVAGTAASPFSSEGVSTFAFAAASTPRAVEGRLARLHVCGSAGRDDPLRTEAADAGREGSRTDVDVLAFCETRDEERVGTCCADGPRTATKAR